MRIWVDADQCPAEIREMVCRAALKNEVEAIFVANHPPPLASSPFLRAVQADGRAEAADRVLAGSVEQADMVITADVPLAADLVERGAVVLHPKGDLFTRENIRQRLSLRDFLAGMRSAGVDTRDSRRYRRRRGEGFAAVFDRELQRRLRKAGSR
jgi:uncharacterized protein YaiI (UPF0178 family)